jgi:hypothetical protein
MCPHVELPGRVTIPPWLGLGVSSKIYFNLMNLSWGKKILVLVLHHPSVACSCACPLKPSALLRDLLYRTPIQCCQRDTAMANTRSVVPGVSPCISTTGPLPLCFCL